MARHLSTPDTYVLAVNVKGEGAASPLDRANSPRVYLGIAEDKHETCHGSFRTARSERSKCESWG